MDTTRQSYFSPEVQIIGITCRNVIAASGEDFTVKNPFGDSIEEECGSWLIETT